MSDRRPPQEDTLWWLDKAKGQNKADKTISEWVRNHPRLIAVVGLWVIASSCGICRILVNN